MSPTHAIELNHRGYTIIPNFLSKDYAEILGRIIDPLFDVHRKIQLNNYNDIVTEGVALHAILNSNLLLNFLEYLMFTLGLKDFLEENYFKSKFILNSFSALNNLPNQPNFSSVIHRDLRFYTGEIPIMINVLVMVDDFTPENGPTLLLPYSHLNEAKPTDNYFHENAIKVIGEAGSILLFNSNIWHASSLNTSRIGRRAIPITFTKSLIKQLLDYPRALGYDKMESFSEPMQQLLGYYSRVPSNLDEWYQPLNKRFYKKDQD